MPSGGRIKQLVAAGLLVPLPQFLVYYLFHKRRPGKPGYRNYKELGAKLAKSYTEIEDWIDISDGTFRLENDVGVPVTAITERYGEAIAMSAINWVHELHEADWEKLPEYQGRSAIPTFDYEHLASDGTCVIQVEAKGTVLDYAQVDHANVRNHRRSIERKKSRIFSASAYPHRADIRYGSIAALPREGVAKCWLADPPSDGAYAPRRRRVLARMSFLLDWISFLLPRSQISAALSTRYSSLTRLVDIDPLNRAPLTRANREPFDGAAPHHLSSVRAEGAVGVILPGRTDELFFVGIKEELLELAALQDFDAVTDFTQTPSYGARVVDCRISRARARRMGVEHLGPPDGAPYVEFPAAGTLFSSAAGAVLGRVYPK